MSYEASIDDVTVDVGKVDTLHPGFFHIYYDEAIGRVKWAFDNLWISPLLTLPESYFFKESLSHFTRLYDLTSLIDQLRPRYEEGREERLSTVGRIIIGPAIAYFTRLCDFIDYMVFDVSTLYKWNERNKEFRNTIEKKYTPNRGKIKEMLTALKIIWSGEENNIENLHEIADFVNHLEFVLTSKDELKKLYDML